MSLISSSQIVESSYLIDGMTCESCVKIIKEKIGAIPGVISAHVQLDSSSLKIRAARKIQNAEVVLCLSPLPKYKVRSEIEAAVSAQENLLTVYQPLLIIFGFIILVSLAGQAKLDAFNFHLFMNHLMAGFFVGFSFFKFLDLRAFAGSFSTYDPLARKFRVYGFAYPFFELSIGLMYIAEWRVPLAQLLSVLLLSGTTVGVYRKLHSTEPGPCACLGTVFKLPLTKVTIVENLSMIAMAIYGYFF